MDIIFMNLKKKLTLVFILALSYCHLHRYNLYSQTSVLLYISVYWTIGTLVLDVCFDGKTSFPLFVLLISCGVLFFLSLFLFLNILLHQ